MNQKGTHEVDSVATKDSGVLVDFGHEYRLIKGFL